MVTGNTETGLSVTYEDSDNTLDFVVDNSDFALAQVQSQVQSHRLQRVMYQSTQQ